MLQLLIPLRNQNLAKPTNPSSINSDCVRGLGVMGLQNIKGGVTIDAVLPGSFFNRPNLAPEQSLQKGDTVCGITVSDKQTGRPRLFHIRTMKQLAEKMENSGSSFSLHVAKPDGTKVQVPVTDYKPSSLLGVSGDMTSTGVLRNKVYPGGVRNLGVGFEVRTIKTDFVASLGVKEHDQIVGLKVGKSYFDIQSIPDLHTAIGHMVPGAPVSLVVCRTDAKGIGYGTVVLSGIAPKFSKAANVKLFQPYQL